MSNVTQLHNTTPEKLQNAILKGVQEQIDFLKKSFQPKEPTEYLTRSEVAKLLKINVSSVHNWTKKGILNRYGVEGRIYYKRQEVEDCLIPLK